MKLAPTNRKGRETRNYKKNAGIHGAVKHAVGAANASERPELTRVRFPLPVRVAQPCPSSFSLPFPFDACIPHPQSHRQGHGGNSPLCRVRLNLQDQTGFFRFAQTIFQYTAFVFRNRCAGRLRRVTFFNHPSLFLIVCRTVLVLTFASFE